MFGEWRPSYRVIDLLLGLLTEIGSAAALLAVGFALALLMANL